MSAGMIAADHLGLAAEVVTDITPGPVDPAAIS
jgi:hypothetical protein